MLLLLHHGMEVLLRVLPTMTPQNQTFQQEERSVDSIEGTLLGEL